MKAFKYRIYPTIEQEKASGKRIEESGVNTLGRMEINACGDESSTTKAVATTIKEARKLRNDQIGHFRSY